MFRTLLVVGVLLALPGSSAAQQTCTTDAAAIVGEIHRQLLERPPDDVTGMAQRLASGAVTPKQLVSEMAHGVEHKSRFLSPFNNAQQRLNAIGYLYRHLLNRPPDIAGSNSYADVAAARGIDFVIDDILASEEYRQAYGDDGVPGSPLRFCGRNAGGTPAAATRPNQQMRFREMDADGDGRISRREWRGSTQSFNVHDWNRDGFLSGEEVRPGGARNRRMEEDDYSPGSRTGALSWSDAEFRSLDRNGDRTITRAEWYYDGEIFYRADRNGDGVVSAAEFFAPDDDDRNDSFEYLDANRNNRIERNEWHGTPGEFSRLDRNRDNVLTRAELIGSTTAATELDLFETIDVNDDNRISSIEWRWSLRSFHQADTNGDGFVTREEFTGRPANVR